MKYLLSRAAIINNSYKVLNSFLAWEVDNEVVGYIPADFSKQLKSFPRVFTFPPCGSKVNFTDKVNQSNLHERTAALDAVNVKLRDLGVITGWRAELLPVQASYSSPQPSVLIERAASAFYGIKAYGIHVNGFVRSPLTGKVSHIWVGKRAATKSTFPGMLDHVVAGALPFGINIKENVIKECAEEASLSEEIARTALPVGACSYNHVDSTGHLKRDAMFCFDLELPEGVHPVPMDGEVESFQLRDVRWVLDKILGNDPLEVYKPNCILVVIDFFIRFEC
jgi:hypothetical protein